MNLEAISIAVDGADAAVLAESRPGDIMPHSDEAVGLFRSSLETLAGVLPMRVNESFDLVWKGHLTEPNSSLYRNESSSFNGRYFLKNFLKSLLVLDRLKRHLRTSQGPFIDIGAGGGPASLAALLMFPESRCVLVDESDEQLRIARSVLASFGLLGRCLLLTEKVGPRSSFGEGQVISSYWMQEAVSDCGVEAIEKFDIFAHPAIIIDDVATCDAFASVVGARLKIASGGTLNFTVQPHGTIGRQIYDNGSCGWLFTDPK